MGILIERNSFEKEVKSCKTCKFSCSKQHQWLEKKNITMTNPALAVIGENSACSVCEEEMLVAWKGFEQKIENERVMDSNIDEIWKLKTPRKKQVEFRVMQNILQPRVIYIGGNIKVSKTGEWIYCIIPEYQLQKILEAGTTCRAFWFPEPFAKEMRLQDFKDIRLKIRKAICS